MLGAPNARFDLRKSSAGLVEEAVADEPMLSLTVYDVVLHVVAALDGILAAEVADVGLLADAAAELDRIVVRRVAGQLGEPEMLAERPLERAGES